MAYNLPSPSLRDYAFEPGRLFLGFDGYNSIGIATERHAITVAGSRSGKGACLIIPNLLRWPHNALCIDPKGENAERSWQAREALGQSVHVIDPFNVADVPDRLRASLNPFDLLDPAALSIREDIRVIADALVMRYRSDDSMWDNGAVSVIAGLIAHVLTTAPPGRRTLPDVRALLNFSDDRLKAVFSDMQDNPSCGGLALAAASIGLSKSKKDLEYLSGAKDNTEWLDSLPMRSILERSTFNLSDLKTGKATVFLVLPPAYISEHSRFLRLFVKLAINAMSKGQTGSRCLFLLDEFFALGRLDEVAKAAGLLPSYGVHLWPFLQDLGQLQTLYGREGAETFFGNSDAQIFFGIGDQLTAEHVSKKLGVLTPSEAALPPQLLTHQATGVPLSVLPLNDQSRSLMPIHQNNIHLTGIQDSNARAYIEAENRRRTTAYQHDMARKGSPRLSPAEIRELVAKKTGDTVARQMIAFAKGSDVFHLPLLPYWMPDPVKPEPAQLDPARLEREIEYYRRMDDRRIRRQNLRDILWLVPRVAPVLIVALLLWWFFSG